MKRNYDKLEPTGYDLRDKWLPLLHAELDKGEVIFDDLLETLVGFLALTLNEKIAVKGMGPDEAKEMVLDEAELVVQVSQRLYVNSLKNALLMVLAGDKGTVN